MKTLLIIALVVSVLAMFRSFCAWQMLADDFGNGLVPFVMETIIMALIVACLFALP